MLVQPAMVALDRREAVRHSQPSPSRAGVAEVDLLRHRASTALPAAAEVGDIAQAVARRLVMESIHRVPLVKPEITQERVIPDRAVVAQRLRERRVHRAEPRQSVATVVRDTHQLSAVRLLRMEEAAEVPRGVDRYPTRREPEALGEGEMARTIPLMEATAPQTQAEVAVELEAVIRAGRVDQAS